MGASKNPKPSEAETELGRARLVASSRELLRAANSNKDKSVKGLKENYTLYLGKNCASLR